MWSFSVLVLVWHHANEWNEEVVLSVLLSKFRFALAEKDIVWEMSAISVPTEKEHPGCPKLPLKVTAL